MLNAAPAKLNVIEGEDKWLHKSQKEAWASSDVYEGHSFVANLSGCFGDSAVLITTGGMVPAERLFHFQSFNAHIDFSQENVSELSCQWTPPTCYAGLTAVGLRSDLPPPSFSFRTYRASLCRDLQVGTLFQIRCLRGTSHTTESPTFFQETKKGE